MKTIKIRQKFLDFFASKGHIIEPSASLIPISDKTLLFVNAGMVPFKDVFSGIEKRNYTRVASSQRCIRAGGKHNDLENVGYTARHHTFFEMLGNFSFGDYFKEEAISYAWEFLTKELKLPADKLWVSVYEEDEEAESIWVNKIGFPKNRISRCGAKDNFWQMGDTGPCGPCSEIFYDHGEHIAGGPPGTADEDGDRFVEIWNLVFTQFDKQEDGYLQPLAKLCVDTGMGLERLAAIMQHKNNNYDIDIFTGLTKAIVKLTKKESKIKACNPSVRVIADHIRAVSFLISDGVIPNNEGRGYVLRRIIRRAIRHGYKLGINNVFFYLLAPILALQTKDIYPDLKVNLALIEKTIKKEEVRFAKTLIDGMSILEDEVANIKNSQISGKIAFKLYDTYGFPLDLITDFAREKNLIVDIMGFNKAMQEQKNRAKKASNFKTKSSISIDKNTEFVGYDNLQNQSNIIAIIKDNVQVESIAKDDNAILVMAESSFYSESGGQVGDSGEIIAKNGRFKVVDTQKQKAGAVEHSGVLLDGVIKINDSVELKVDGVRRLNIMRNHSATHLLHAALKQVLGENVNQKGSLVDDNKLRFDFSYDKALTLLDINQIEAVVNYKILANTSTHTELTDIKSATKKGVIALFGEKYGDEVRVLTMGCDNFSVELCGGTHVKRLGDIGSFRIINEVGVASGVRRIEAVTGIAAYIYDKKIQQNIDIIAKNLKSDSNNVVVKVEQLLKVQKDLENKINVLQKKLGSNLADELAEKAKIINEIKVLSIEVVGVEKKDLRDLMDKLKVKLKTAIIVLALVTDDKIALVSGVTKDIVDKYNAGKILSVVAGKLDGKAGGRVDMAQGGGVGKSKLKDALTSVYEVLK